MHEPIIKKAFIMTKFSKISRITASIFLGMYIGTVALADTLIYTYDALGRLIITSHKNDDDRLYTYDDAGNRTQITVYENGLTGNYPPVCTAMSDVVAYAVTSSWTDVVTSNCSDPEGQTLTLSAVTQPGNGATAYVSGTTDVYMTNLPVGASTVTFTVSDGNGGTDSASLIVTRESDGNQCWPFCF